MKLITLTTDFGVQSQSVGIMEAMVLSISPQTKIIHLMHGLPSYNILAAARTLETIKYVPIGCHICVCDPGVGTSRKAIAIKVNRGDYLLGPDNGVLLPAARILGGIKYVHEIRNEKYMNLPVSPIFHGRDIFSPAAAYLVNGVKMKYLGPQLKIESLIAAPFDEAVRKNKVISAIVIQINKFGSIHLNILHEDWDKLSLKFMRRVTLNLSSKISLKLPFCIKFGDVDTGKNLILKDDFGRIEIAINQGSFAEKYKIKIGARVTLII